MQPMNTPRLTSARRLSLAYVLLLLFEAPHRLLAEPTPTALATFDVYTKTLESRLAQQHRSPGNYLTPIHAETALRSGGLIIERVTPPEGISISGAMLYHWRGTAFAPGATAVDFERLIRNFNTYPQHFAPQVLQARILTQSPNRMTATMRVRQHHVITVVMDATCDIAFGQLDPQHGYSISRSTRIAEIASPGTPSERTLSPSEEHGFLWRLNTYWSYEQRDGGLYLQVESVSLTRSIPSGLGWAIRPYVESIPRESLEFTLRSACNAIRK